MKISVIKNTLDQVSTDLLVLPFSSDALKKEAEEVLLA